MRRHLHPAMLIVPLLLMGGVCTSGATVRGLVQAEGKRLPEGEAEGGTYKSRKYKFIQKMDYDRLGGFVVFVDQEVEGPHQPPKKPVSVHQHNARFVPHILPVMQGTTVLWPNHDDIYHNAFSYSDAKPFDLGLYKKQEKRVTFDKPGRIDVFCSIHRHMHCIILVLENPFFAVADSRGRYLIHGLPAGTYQLKAWHERLPPQSKEITIPKDVAEPLEVNFNLGIKNLPKY